MQRKYAESVEEYYLCPLCMFGSCDWDDVVEHMIEDHTDDEAINELGIDP